MSSLAPDPLAPIALPVLHGIPNCDTVKRARAWLEDRGFEHRFLDFKKGGVAAVRLEGAGGELTVLLRPRELALIADAQGLPAGAGAGVRGLDGPGGR